MDARLCKDCKHYGGGESRASDLCRHPSAQPAADLVRGEVRLRYCSDERLFGLICSSEGKLWEPRT